MKQLICACMISTGLFFMIPALQGCNGRSMFGKKNPREAYLQALEQSELSGTAMGRQWIAAGDRALTTPVTIDLPFRMTGFFPVDQPLAVCFRLNANRGQKITVSLRHRPVSARLFTELLTGGSETEPGILGTIDSSGNLEYEADDDGSVYLRLQPELLQAVSYELEITAGPSLAFPVSGGRASDIGSVWGDPRDAGRRRHEGIDIFGKRGTPLVAAADGIVTRVGEGGLGGKVVWMRAKGRNLSLYYAHLDEQLVRTGESVEKGDTLGLMGNTGNARTTPVHLHFGIYTGGGAVDPLPFVKPSNTKPAPVTADTGRLGQAARIARAGGKKQGSSFPANSYTRIIGATGATYLTVSPDGSTSLHPSGYIAALSPLRQTTPGRPLKLYALPDTGTAVITRTAINSVTLLAKWEEFSLVQAGGIRGWTVLP